MLIDPVFLHRLLSDCELNVYVKNSSFPRYKGTICGFKYDFRSIIILSTEKELRLRLYKTLILPVAI